MSKFDKILEQYKTEILKEQPEVDQTAVEPEAPMPDAGVPEEPQAPDPKDVVDELEKASKKPWVDLAGILSRAIEYKWSNDDVNKINESLPGGLTIRDFIDVRTSPRLKDKYDSNIVSSAVTLFDVVEKIMGRDDMDRIVPAEER